MFSIFIIIIVAFHFVLRWYIYILNRKANQIIITIIIIIADIIINIIYYHLYHF